MWIWSHQMSRGWHLTHCFAVSPVSLLTEVRLDLLPEDQHPKVRVRGLVHGFGLDTHAILLWSEFVCTMFLVPEVKETRDGCPDHNKVTVQVLSVEVNVLTAPAFHFQVKTPYKNNSRKHYFGTQARCKAKEQCSFCNVSPNLIRHTRNSRAINLKFSMPKHAKLREGSFKHSTSFAVEAAQDTDHALLASEGLLEQHLWIALCMTSHVPAAENCRQTSLAMLLGYF